MALGSGQTLNDPPGPLPALQPQALLPAPSPSLGHPPQAAPLPGTRAPRIAAPGITPPRVPARTELSPSADHVYLSPPAPTPGSP